MNRPYPQSQPPYLPHIDYPQPDSYTRSCERGSSSVVECFLDKEDVAGSTPVSRSKNPLPAVHFTYNSEGLQVNSPPEARYPSGKGEVCKTFMRRFDPDPRLQISSTIRRILSFLADDQYQAVGE